MRSRPRSRLALAVLLCTAALVLLLVYRKANRGAPSLPAGPRPAAGGSLAVGACAGPAPEAQNAAFEQQVIELVNAERRAAGLPSLEVAEPLAAAARWFARDMAQEGYFAPDHATYHNVDGKLVRACDWSTRIAAFAGDWTALGENIASGAASPRQVVAGWMSSPPHKARILDRSFSETGVGYWSGGPQGSYWVEDFGRR
jgi:uncharacterized protein YkwD